MFPVNVIFVPDRRRRDNPKVVAARRGVFGVWGSREGEGGGRVGSRGVSLQATWD